MTQNNPDIQRSLQVFTTGLSLATLGALMIWIRRNLDRWYYAIPPAFWLLHVLIFYLSVLAESAGFAFKHPEFAFWSELVRLHAVTTIAGIAAAMLLDWIRPYKKLL